MRFTTGLHAPGIKTARRRRLTTVSARLRSLVTLEPHADGTIVACFEGRSISLGAFTASVVDRIHDLRAGLPLVSFASERRRGDKELELLLRRLARHGLLAYRVGRSQSDDVEQAIIEPQTVDYWPRESQLGDADVVVLSRFAYMRRRGNELVLESPRSGALFRICDPKVAAIMAMLAEPQEIKRLRRRDGFPGIRLLALLANCRILFKIDAAGDSGRRPTEGDDDLVLWDFHDLLFHTRSTAGRQANPLGGLYRYADLIAPLPAVRPSWPGKRIDLSKISTTPPRTNSPIVRLLRERHSTRIFDDQHPITLAELSQFLDSTARVLWTAQTAGGLNEDGPAVEYAGRPYPSAGSSYELELYLAVCKCEGLAQGFYHYDAGGHVLAPIEARPHELEALLGESQFAMGVAVAPQILITIAARFGRVSWKYSSIAYALILKDVGVLTQTFYMMATDMGLGGCAAGITNIDLFAKVTGIDFHVEGPVGQFAIGRLIRP